MGVAGSVIRPPDGSVIDDPRANQSGGGGPPPPSSGLTFNDLPVGFDTESVDFE